MSESTAGDLFAHLMETTRLLADAQRRHHEADVRVEKAKAERMALANTCIALGEERARVLQALSAAVDREAGLGVAEPERGVVATVEAVYGTPAVVPGAAADTVDFGG